MLPPPPITFPAPTAEVFVKLSSMPDKLLLTDVVVNGGGGGEMIEFIFVLPPNFDCCCSSDDVVEGSQSLRLSAKRCDSKPFMILLKCEWPKPMIDDDVDELLVEIVAVVLPLLQMVELDTEPADEEEELFVSLMRKTL